MKAILFKLKRTIYVDMIEKKKKQLNLHVDSCIQSHELTFNSMVQENGFEYQDNLSINKKMSKLSSMFVKVIMNFSFWLQIQNSYKKW